MGHLTLLLFILAYYFFDIYVATASLMLCTTAECGWHYWQTRQITFRQSLLLPAVWLLGSATLLLRDPRFIMFKPTLVYSAMALLLWVPRLRGTSSHFAAMAQQVIAAPSAILQKLELQCIAFLFFLAAINTGASILLSTNHWLQLKLFGFPCLTMMLFMLQYLYYRPHITLIDDNTRSENRTHIAP